MQMIVPADLMARARGIIGVPFLPKGDTPEGWDCQGLARWCLLDWCDVYTPSHRDLYDAAIVSPWGRQERARLLAEGFGRWRPVEPQAGVVAWLEWLGAAGHVGFMLSDRLIVHADTRCGTAILDLDDPAAGYRLKGAFVPESITDIVHLGKEGL